MAGRKKNKLIKKAGYKKRMYFRNNEDYYGDSPIRTKFEFMAEGFLKEADIPYLVNQVFCFTCNRFYPYESRSMPSLCAFCKISFKGDDKGHISRPDFIIDFNENRLGINPKYDFKKIGIIRIDGIVHNRIKATRIRDHHILNAFKERDIKVFIIKNETFLDKSVKELRELFLNIKEMMWDDSLYRDYTKSKDFEELAFCPDLQVRRYNKKK